MQFACYCHCFVKTFSIDSREGLHNQGNCYCSVLNAEESFCGSLLHVSTLPPGGQNAVCRPKEAGGWDLNCFSLTFSAYLLTTSNQKSLSSHGAASQSRNSQLLFILTAWAWLVPEILRCWHRCLRFRVLHTGRVCEPECDYIVRDSLVDFKRIRSRNRSQPVFDTTTS